VLDKLVNPTLVRKLEETESVFLRTHQEFPALYSIVCEVLADIAVSSVQQQAPTSQQISKVCQWLQNFTTHYTREPIPKVCFLLVRIFYSAGVFCKGALSHSLVQLPKECKVLWALKQSVKNISNEFAYGAGLAGYLDVLEEV
jgi:hypothetical protein